MLKTYHLVRYPLSPCPLQFDVFDTNKGTPWIILSYFKDNYVAGHSSSDPLLLDIVQIWDLRKNKPFCLSPTTEANPTALKVSSKLLAVGLSVSNFLIT